MASKVLGIVAGAIAAASIAASAQANTTILILGLGPSGTTLIGPPLTFATDLKSTDSFGMPGVGAGTELYTGSAPVIQFEINFSSLTGGAIGVIDPASITLGNTDGCAGDATGGTTFCSGGVHWTATQTGLDSITFTAPKGVTLTDGEDFFFNVFFIEGPAPTAFDGLLTTTPEPATWAMMIAGVGLTGFALRRRYRLAKAT
jgi:hypothetical protein